MRKPLVFGIVAWAALAVGASAQTPPASGQSGQPADQSTSRSWEHSDRNAREITLTGCLQSAAESATGTSGSSDTMGSASSSSQSSRSSQKDSKNAQFILTNATIGSGSSTGSASGESAGAASGSAPSASNPPAPGAPSGSATGTSGSKPADEASTSGGSSYRLVGDTQELQRYVGQKVEIHGRLDSGNRKYPGSESSTEPVSGSSTTGSTTGTATGETTGTSTTGAPTSSSSSQAPASGTVGGQAGAYGSGMEMSLVHVTSVRSLGTSCSESQK